MGMKTQASIYILVFRKKYRHGSFPEGKYDFARRIPQDLKTKFHG